MTAELDNKGCKVFGMMIISQYVVLKVCIKIKYLFKMREWLRGGAPPCQGGGRGFESRLALFLFSEDPGFAGSFIFVYKNEKAGSEEPAIHGTIRSAPFS